MPRKYDEIDPGMYPSDLAECLDDLGKASGDAHVTFIEGNHEFRLPRYMLNIAPALNLPGLTPRDLFRVDARGWRWVPYRRAFSIGPVTFTHDLERAGVNAVRQAVADLRRSVVIGHLHRMAVHHEGDADGVHLFGACFGWLGDFERLSYRHRARALREWQHGFGVIWIDGGRAFPQAIPIVDRVAVVGERRMVAT